MKCYTSIPKTIGLLVLGILMLGGCYFCTTLPGLKPQIVGWIGLVFFGLCFLAIGRQLFRSEASVVLDDVGIHDLRSSFGLIPWADITSLRIAAVRSTRFLCVEVHDASIYLSRLPAHKRLLAQANPSLGFPPITISFSGLSPGLNEVWTYVQKTCPATTVA